MSTDTDAVKTQPVQDNAYQAVSRYKKARKIATTLIGLGVTDVSPEPTDEQLAVWAGMAKVNVPSLTTWALVRHLINEDLYTALVIAAVDATDLALALGKRHPDFPAAKVDMDQKIAALTEAERKQFSQELDLRLGTHSFRPE